MGRKENSRILIISDLHAPYMHPDTVAFLRATKRKYKPDRVILTGDEADFHATSFHDHDPELPSAGDELAKTQKALRPIFELFPQADVLESNHGSLVFRKAYKHGLPTEVVKSYREILQAPKGWNWHFDLTLVMSNGQKLYCHHSKGANVLSNSQRMGMCFVQGHHHSTYEIRYWANPNALLWGMTVGCLADTKSRALSYSKNNLGKEIIGVGVIVNGLAQLVPMVLNKQGRWVGKL